MSDNQDLQPEKDGPEKDEVDSFAGQFLISLPSLQEDYFHDTISLIIDHNAEGAFGLVVNQELETEVNEIFPEVPAHTHIPVLEGGPVEPNRVFFLHPTGPEYQSTLVINNHVSLTTSEDFVQAMIDGSAPANSLIILGYAGWGEGQLESEIMANVWLLTPFDHDVLFDLPFEERPQAAAKRFGVDLNLISSIAGHD